MVFALPTELDLYIVTAAKVRNERPGIMSTSMLIGAKDSIEAMFPMFSRHTGVCDNGLEGATTAAACWLRVAGIVRDTVLIGEVVNSSQQKPSS